MHIIEQECSYACFCCLLSYSDEKFKIPSEFLKREMKN
jgi:hypothetical protein